MNPQVLPKFSNENSMQFQSDELNQLSFVYFFMTKMTDHVGPKRALNTEIHLRGSKSKNCCASLRSSHSLAATLVSQAQLAHAAAIYGTFIQADKNRLGYSLVHIH